jgi:hypothetical protein
MGNTQCTVSRPQAVIRTWLGKCKDNRMSSPLAWKYAVHIVNNIDRPQFWNENMQCPLMRMQTFVSPTMGICSAQVKDIDCCLFLA